MDSDAFVFAYVVKERRAICLLPGRSLFLVFSKSLGYRSKYIGQMIIIEIVPYSLVVLFESFQCLKVSKMHVSSLACGLGTVSRNYEKI